ncbi:NAD-dependent epimerase/dehydratase family protein [Methylobacterium sp. NEAU 140]|uniref:NAD-dependent epimerase/dehydratase family protein n=1 Tax=Methylobacterium sp. NEAU 140 TaxID=3064945 RepID=UPI0027347C79|nr:NAD-dependent epimerase/dehydratase family protein [Methylobacterium sp. NEAU 140]MDP4024719.1 NAD-dependent epimerase/dehydratase family protein [Methylobacterium sp. NEAU 140]
MRRILVTGAAGFVGGHVLPLLARGPGRGGRVAGIGRGPAPSLPTGVAYARIDLLDAEALAGFVADFRPTAVLHLAGLASVADSASGPAQTWRVNVDGLLNLVAAMRAAPGCTLFFVSTGEVYGSAFLAGHALTEDAEPQPRNTYARSKWVGEQVLHDLLPRIGVKLVVLRPFNHIGPGQDERFVVASFAGQIARIEAGRAPPRLEVGNLTSRRDFLDVADVADAYARLIDRADDLPDGSVFNIGSGCPRTIASALDGLRAVARTPFEIHVAPERVRPAEIPLAAGDSGRLRAATGWAPRVAWEASLAGVLDDARARLAAAP